MVTVSVSNKQYLAKRLKTYFFTVAYISTVDSGRKELPVLPYMFHIREKQMRAIPYGFIFSLKKIMDKQQNIGAVKQS